MVFLRFKFNLSSLTGVIAAFFLFFAAKDLWHYLRLEKKTVAHVEAWKVVKKSSSAYAIKTSYTYTLGNTAYRGKTILSKPYHLNRLSAENHIKNLNRLTWTAWYQPSHPEVSSLQRIFPAKKSLYALMTLVIFLYFLYLQTRNKENLDLVE